MLILASQSPRRRRLLEEAGIAFLADPANAPEAPWDGKHAPAEHVVWLAKAKAGEVVLRHPGQVVLAADTVVVKNDRIHGKPHDLAEAKRMLADLAGDAHEVLTGVVLQRDGKILASWVSRTTVHFKPLTPKEIEDYCRAVNVLDKAGAYGIQEHGEMLVKSIDGLRSNVIGLPIETVLATLENLGIKS